MLLELSALGPLIAESSFIVWARFIPCIVDIAIGKSRVLSRSLVLVETLVALLAVAIFLEVPANGQLIFVIHVQEATLVSFFARAL
jgi:hypothetical protein